MRRKPCQFCKTTREFVLAAIVVTALYYWWYV